MEGEMLVKEVEVFYLYYFCCQKSAKHKKGGRKKGKKAPILRIYKIFFFLFQMILENSKIANSKMMKSLSQPNRQNIDRE